MFYRIHIDLAFRDIDPLNDLKEEALRKIPFAFTICPGTPNQERGFIKVEQCYHDEASPIPCVLIAAQFTP